MRPPVQGHPWFGAALAADWCRIAGPGKARQQAGTLDAAAAGLRGEGLNVTAAAFDVTDRDAALPGSLARRGQSQARP
jgi:hypothetical protein